MSRSTSRFSTWLQLIRAPNLFTVPGDPIAGYILASFGALDSALLLAVTASLCLYAAGLLDNDLADLAEDRAERPQRPLPSGAARPVTVAIVALLLLVCALSCAAAVSSTTFNVAAVLAAAIVFYNHWGKRVPVFGPLNMGACRGLSVLLGATAAPHGDFVIPLLLRGRLDPLFVAIVFVTLYIAAITHLARHETKESVPPDAKWLPVSALLFGMIIFLRLLPAPSLAGGVAGFIEQFTPTFWSVFFLFMVAMVTSVQITWKVLLIPRRGFLLLSANSSGSSFSCRLRSAWRMPH
jgi:4-hydroxybenzoate polyprenyltransferase